MCRMGHHQLGTHGTVVIYYSPDVYRWMCEGDAAHERRFVAECRKTCPTCRLEARPARRGPIADGSMILKLMYGNTTAQRLEDPAIPKEEPSFIALMVRDSQGGKDGWYWGSWDPQATEASQLDWPPPANLPYPWMGFGYYCVNCHASAQDESTFSHLNNVLGDPDTLRQVLLPGPAAHPRPPRRAAAAGRRDDLRPRAVRDAGRSSSSKIESSGPSVEQGAVAEPGGEPGQPAAHRVFSRVPEDVRRQDHRAARPEGDHQPLHAAGDLRSRCVRSGRAARSSSPRTSASDATPRARPACIST